MLVILSFLSSVRNEFISLSFLKDIFTRYRIYNWQFFTFSTWKIYPTSFWFLSFQMRNPLSFNWCSPIDNSHFSLGTFNISSLSLVFRSLIMMCLILDFFFFLIYPVWIHLPLESIGFGLRLSFGRSSVIVSSNILLSLFFCPLLGP